MLGVSTLGSLPKYYFAASFLKEVHNPAISLSSDPAVWMSYQNSVGIVQIAENIAASWRHVEDDPSPIVVPGYVSGLICHRLTLKFSYQTGL